MKENGTIEITPEQTQAAMEVLGAVNLDEVTNEIVRVKIRYYKEVDMVDDDGEPLLDEDNKPLKRRKVSTRTAEILNFVPLPIYSRMQGLRDKLTGGDTELQIDTMTDLVLAVWKLSEPWMTREKLCEGLDFSALGALFTRFFNESRLQKDKA